MSRQGNVPPLLAKAAFGLFVTILVAAAPARAQTAAAERALLGSGPKAVVSEGRKVEPASAAMDGERALLGRQPGSPAPSAVSGAATRSGERALLGGSERSVRPERIARVRSEG